MKVLKNIVKLFPFLLLVGCAGFARDCQGCGASSFGADWIIVQYKFDGEPVNCWKLKDASVTNEHASDGIWWVGNEGHLVHVSGWYNRVQVNNSNYESAAKELGIDLKRCTSGKYLPETLTVKVVE